MNPPARCGWLRRYRHRWLRRRDRRRIRPLFDAQCRKIAADLGQVTNLEPHLKDGLTLDELTRQAAESAWTDYCAAPGRDYWRCPCAGDVMKS